MTTYTISGDSVVRQTLALNDVLNVTPSGYLHPSGNAIDWNLATTGQTFQITRITNNGLIEAATGHAIEAVSTATTRQYLFLDNKAGATVRARDDVIHVATPLATGTVEVANSGMLRSDLGNVLDIAVQSGVTWQPGNVSYYVTNYAGGTIRSDGGAAIRLSNLTPGEQVTGYSNISNFGGQILSYGKGAQAGAAIDLSDYHTAPGFLTRINSWEPQGNILAADADAIRTGDYTEVANIGGTIRAGGGAGHDGVDVGTSVGVTISNSKGAAIYGSGSGIAGSAAVKIDNSGVIGGRLDAGIYLQTAPTAITTILNKATGVIKNYEPTAANGDAIRVTGLVDVNNAGLITSVTPGRSNVDKLVANALVIGGGKIVNSGTISSDCTTILVDQATGGLTLTNSGQIRTDISYGGQGHAVQINGSFNDTIVNSGTIYGIVDTGGGNDFIDNSTGTIDGDIFGGDGNDTIFSGTSFARHLYGGAGDDTIYAASNTLFDAGDGNDHLIGYGVSGQRLYAGAGDDTVELITGIDAAIIDGGSGYDTFILDRSSATTPLVFGIAPPTVSSVVPTGFEVYIVTGTQYDDRLSGEGVGDVTFRSGDGNDLLIGGTGTNLLIGGAGDDRYQVYSTTTKIIDDSGNDFVSTWANYTINVNIETVAMIVSGLTVTGNWQANTVWGSAGTDIVFGEGGNDLIGGKDGDDELHGGAANDSLYGDGGNDILYGDDGRDNLHGGAGNDILIGGANYDQLYGDGGADIFRFLAVTDSSAAEPDLIVDFSHAEGDTIDLAAIAPFAWLGTGAFTNHAGELRYSVSGGDALVEADVNGDGLADLAIRLKGVTALGADDFLL